VQAAIPLVDDLFSLERGLPLADWIGRGMRVVPAPYRSNTLGGTGTWRRFWMITRTGPRARLLPRSRLGAG